MNKWNNLKYYRRASKRTSVLSHCNNGWSAVRSVAPLSQGRVVLVEPDQGVGV
ncbi:MAG: hypothetical protein IT528_10270 [Nitrosomonas sp.]|nr:hypothetical protein [Nitrosomonas sp.]